MINGLHLIDQSCVTKDVCGRLGISMKQQIRAVQVPDLSPPP